MNNDSENSAATMLKELLSNTLEREAEGFFLCPCCMSITYSKQEHSGLPPETDPGPKLSPDAFRLLIACIKKRCGINLDGSVPKQAEVFLHHNDNGEHLFSVVIQEDDKGESVSIGHIKN